MTDEGQIAAADREQILSAARDYIESWLNADGQRMARCLHPDLVKRSTAIDPATGGCTIDTLSRDEMVTATAAGQGAHNDRPYEVSILEAYADCASVRVLSTPYVDYLHVARCGSAWLILNILWQRRVGR